MADTSHLERMGRELKCPICLSLFNSAVSLSCNHVFCNACIVKSMKMDATCPVCKIPYHRREIRGAPHMDSLVSIYKNMEDASGVNIFVSQNNPSPLDKEKHVGDAHVAKENDKTRQVSRKGRTSKSKEYGKTKETDVDAPGPIVMKPSSQTKKRVQLQQNLSSESLTKPTESVEIDEEHKRYNEKTVISLEERPCVNIERNLPPFFWLRDEDDWESSSQRTESDQLLDSSPVNVPSFSDLKDSESDHESPSKADEQEKPNPGNMFDSEMFEWTQRPCSPEILPSPVKAKVLGRGNIDHAQRKLSEPAPSKYKNRKAGGASNAVASLHAGVPSAAGLHVEHYMESSAAGNIGEKKDSRGTSTPIIRKDGNPDENVKTKRVTRSKGHSSRAQSGQDKSKEADVKQGTKRKRSSVNSSPALPSAECYELSPGKEIAGKGDQDGAHGSPDIQPEKQSPTEKPSLKKRGRKSNASSSQNVLSGRTQKTSEKRSKLDSDLISSKAAQLHGKDVLTDELNQVGDRQDSTKKKKLTVNKGNQKKTSEKKSKPDSHLISSKAAQLHGKDVLNDELNQVGGRQDSTKKKPTVDKGNHTMQVLEKCSTINKPPSGNSVRLRRCDAPSTIKFTCAFCQSSEDTEASGEMAHYHRGEPVSADFNGGSKVTHVHKNCAEWAPNVYFNNLTAVNLDVELTRSRRISCSCCGLKGAALGCYNQSCKNSFHVTCAKLIPECRWDNDNFVMLCPLDASIKLPCEETNLKNRKRKRTPKEPLHYQPNQVCGKTNIGELQSKHFHGLSKKLLLSCSGLTVEEKTVITEFVELSGVTISKKWEPSVTHVIASINENGACKRTLKFMMGILEGKWILNIEWIKACMKSAKYVSEEPYEITMDVHGIREGPYLGRQRALNKKPKLFNGLKFYIMGDFEHAYKGYLQDLIVAAGGTILRRKPIANGNEASTIIVFSVEASKNKTLTQRRSDAEALAKSARARSASSSWVLDSIAGCQILDLI